MFYPPASRQIASARRWPWIAAAGALLALAAFYCQPDAPAPAALTRQAPAQAAFAPGPGVLTDAAMAEPMDDIGSHGALEVTPDQRLLPNAALRDVLDYFLLARADAAAKLALHDYLRRKIAPGAVADAMRIADTYLAYMKEHDALLAAHNLRLQGANVTRSDLARLAIWRTQRERLRQRSLGQQLVQAWYQDDDLQTLQAIDELQRTGEDPAIAQTQQAGMGNATPFRPVPRWNNPADEERHHSYLLDVITRAITSFDALKHAQTPSTRRGSTRGDSAA